MQKRLLALVKDIIMIEMQSVSKRLGNTQMVNSVSAVLLPGEVFGLLGPNGSGKSTLIGMLMNSIQPDSGRILYDSKPFVKDDINRFGYLSEERAKYKDIKINEMLLYLSSQKNGDALATRQRLDEWLYRFDLADWKNKPVTILSRGMSQKIQFIASILHDPDYVFFDEPFAGLDPVSTEHIKEGIAELASNGKTVLLSTHNLGIAEELCSRILILDKGHVSLSGNLADIRNGYGHNVLTIELDGSYNLLPILDKVRNVSQHNHTVEMELISDSYLQEIIKTLISQVSIRGFEVVAPSLHKIYMDRIRASAIRNDKQLLRSSSSCELVTTG